MFTPLLPTLLSFLPFSLPSPDLLKFLPFLLIKSSTPDISSHFISLSACLSLLLSLSLPLTLLFSSHSLPLSRHLSLFFSLSTSLNLFLGGSQEHRVEYHGRGLHVWALDCQNIQSAQEVLLSLHFILG